MGSKRWVAAAGLAAAASVSAGLALDSIPGRLGTLSAWAGNNGASPVRGPAHPAVDAGATLLDAAHWHTILLSDAVASTAGLGAFVDGHLRADRGRQ